MRRLVELRWVGVLGAMLMGSVLAACSGSDPEAEGMLPASNEIQGWMRTEPVVIIDTDTKLYNQLDGAAPKYIDLGWKASTYATYSQGASTLAVFVHEMDLPENAQRIFDRYLPVSRIVVQESPMAVVDTGLATAYASLAWKNHYYVEASIDERSDPALAALEAFTLRILAR